MQIILLPYPTGNLSLLHQIQKKVSPDFRHSCIGFKNLDQVWNLSGDGLTKLSYSEYVKEDYLVIYLGNVGYPDKSIAYFKDKKVTLLSLALGAMNIHLVNQYWCTDFVSSCLDELGILSYNRKRHPREFVTLLK